MGIPCRIHRRLHVFKQLKYSLTIMYKILLCTLGGGLQLASVILYCYYHCYQLIVWTVSVLVGCVMYVWPLYRYFCTLLVRALRIWQYRIPSDHRGMFLDLNTYSIFEQPPEEAAPSTKRDFRTSNPGVIAAYVTAKIAYLNDHHFFDRLTQMEALSAPDHDLAESLDRDFQRASLHAARMCRKNSALHGVPNSQKLWLNFITIVFSHQPQKIR